MFSNNDANRAIQRRMFKIEDGSITIVCNTLEATKFVYIDNLSAQADSIYQIVLDKIEEEAGKYYIIQPENSALAKYIRSAQPSQLSKIEGANPLFTEISETKKFKEINSQDYQLKVYFNESNNPSFSAIAEKISAFQIQSLCDIRDDLSDEVAKKKIEDRYKTKMIEKKLKSNAIAIFTAEKEGAIVSTLVVTSFSKDGLLNQSSQHLYASDLILNKNLIDNQEFISQFMGHVYKSVQSIFPNANVITLLAPGQKLGKCISQTTQKDGSPLCKKLSAEEQDQRGLITYFVAPKVQLQNTVSSSSVSSSAVTNNAVSALPPITQAIQSFGVRAATNPTNDSSGNSVINTQLNQHLNKLN